ncbi:hypothetical protein Lalb_Chr07g0192591 [Lupinus albus]|uniref:Uncharacterized protein n=1 Tax=Lupinus albus TaxID=3870 RepID=A0A6A4QB01_LUPAL|nr:hypothetical protein Lalb_Chr07g0192591 [Lupinus albus]
MLHLVVFCDNFGMVWIWYVATTFYECVFCVCDSLLLYVAYCFVYQDLAAFLLELDVGILVMFVPHLLTAQHVVLDYVCMIDFVHLWCVICVYGLLVIGGGLACVYDR